MKQTMVSLAILAMTTTQTLAQEADASTLYNLCMKNDPLCESYLMGATTIMVMMGKAYEDKDFEPDFIAPLGTFAICSKGGPVNGRVLHNIFVAWIEIDPKRKNEPLGGAVMTALKDAWPCPPRSH
jgi:hypothetical protein